MNINPSVRHLPMLAAAIGNRLGIKVVFGSTDTAATDGKTIYLPESSAVGTEEDCILQEGLIDHEASHLRFTDFSVGSKGGSNLVKALRNIMEDVRIERQMATVYPGVPANIRRTLEILIKRGVFSKEAHVDAPLPVLLKNTLLLGLRSSELGQDMFTANAEKYLSALRDQLGHSLVSEIWGTAVKGCWSGSTHEVHEAAVQIERLIEDATTPPPEDQDQPDDEPVEHHEPTDDSDVDQEAPANPGGGNEPGTGNDQQEPASDQNSGQEASSSSQGQGIGDKGLPSAEEIAKAAQALLDQMKDSVIADEVAVNSDLGDAVKGELPMSNRPFRGPASDADAKGQSFGRGKSVLIGETWSESTLAALASSMVHGLDRKLETLLEAKADTHRETARSGLLAGHRLSRIAVGCPTIFYRQHEAEALNTAVMVVADLSSSMGTKDVAHGEGKISREQAAAAATYALTRSMGRLDIPYAVVQFNDGKKLVGGGFGSCSTAVRGLLRGAKGGTNTPAALRGAVELLAHRHEDRKLVILIVDGEDDPVEMEAVLAETLRYGIQVAGVFIGNDGVAIRRLFGGDMVQVTSSQDIARALFSALENVTK